MRGVATGSSSDFYARLKYASAIAYLIFSLILLRLWYLQCLHGDYFRDKSENNRTRLLKTVAPRGSLFDREGRLLVGNRPAFNVAVMREDTPDVDKVLSDVASIIGRPKEELENRLKGKKTRPFELQIIAADVSRSELAKVKANTYRLPGVIVDVAPRRQYPFQNLASHLFGYAREISKEELSVLGSEYERGDLIGKNGLELSQESSLKGKNGSVSVEVDAGGRRRKELGLQDYVSGNDVHLTIDLDLQLAAEEAMAGRRGSVVAMDPKNGDVLALVSGPSYDANIFSGEIEAETWRSLTGDIDKPLNNRAIASAYPPGSTFKLIAAIAGLAEKLVTPATKFKCPGYYQFGRRKYRCHKREGHGTVNLRQAITMSCNVYFYQLGVMLGIERLSKYGEFFGLGKLSGIPIQGEKSGIMPSKKWKKEKIGEQWWPGDTIPVTIGQGYLTTTPLQLALAISAIANDGTLYQPRLVRKQIDVQTGEMEELPVQPKGIVPVPRSIFVAVREMSGDVVNHERGTGKRAMLSPVIVGGKTGTAQVSRLGSDKDNERLKDHAWFVSYAPVEEPMIVVVAIVENSGHGGVEAAPVSKAVMEQFFLKKGMIEPEPEKDGLSTKPKTPEASTSTAPDPEPLSDIKKKPNQQQEQATSEEIAERDFL